MGNGQGSREAPENPFVSQASLEQSTIDMAIWEDNYSKILSMWVIRVGQLLERKLLLSDKGKFRRFKKQPSLDLDSRVV
jgi:hypothetical protein